MTRSFVVATLAAGFALGPLPALAQPAGTVAEPVQQLPLEGVASASAPIAAQTSVATLSAADRDLLLRHLLDEKPDPAAYAAASALLPGAGQLALGEWKQPALVWGVLLLASAGVYALKTHAFGIHPAFLGTTPYVLAFGVDIPNTSPADNPNDFFNRFLQIGYLGAAAWTGYQTYQLAIQKRAQIDQVDQSLNP